MQGKTSTSQKIGWVVFWIGAIYMLGMGWLYSWWMVPAANEIGPDAMSGAVGFIWALSAPLGSVLVAVGAALIARAERRLFWPLMIVGILIFVAWRVIGTTSQLCPPLFGIGGGLITLFFLGSVWNWARLRPALSGPEKTGSDLRMVSYVFYVVAAWDLCGLLGMANFVLRPELAQKFAIPHSSTINAASTVLVLLVLGWGFTFFSQQVALHAKSQSA
jgi:hypothetical protein